jgi:type II secretory pathway predicted ATPase ExeA
VNRNQGQAEQLAGESSPVRRADRVDARIVEHAFGETANPDEYVPRRACEEVLGRLERIVFDLGEPAALIAQPGMGKSLLMRVFARRMADRASPIELVYGALSFEDLCEWTLSLAGETVTGLPSYDLQHLLKRRDILLSIDDASSLPTRTARGLRILANHRPRLHLVLATNEDHQARQVLAAFGEPLHRVRLLSPLDADEALQYLTCRLAHWGASDELIDQLPERITRMLRLSGGVPRRMHSIIKEVLGVGDPAPGFWDDERWT